MAKKESTFVNMVLTLFVITLVASAALGFVYEATKEPIAEAKMKQKADAIKEVIPEFNNSPLDSKKTINIDGGSVVMYEAKKDSTVVGIAVETFTNKGFGGLVKIMVGFNPEGNIYNYAVLEHKETPGLGTKMSEWFKTDKNNQNVIGKNPGIKKFMVSKDGGDVDAITAATISSRAFCDAINRAYSVFSQEFEK